MTEEQFSVSLHAFSRRRPFRHFLIEFFSGQQVKVRHPEGTAPFAGVWLFQEPGGEHVVYSSLSFA